MEKSFTRIKINHAILTLLITTSYPPKYQIISPVIFFSFIFVMPRGVTENVKSPGVSPPQLSSHFSLARIKNVNYFGTTNTINFKSLPFWNWKKKNESKITLNLIFCLMTQVRRISSTFFFPLFCFSWSLFSPLHPYTRFKFHRASW